MSLSVSASHTSDNLAVQRKKLLARPYLAFDESQRRRAAAVIHRYRRLIPNYDKNSNDKTRSADEEEPHDNADCSMGIDVRLSGIYVGTYDQPARAIAGRMDQCVAQRRLYHRFSPRCNLPRSGRHRPTQSEEHRQETPTQRRRS